MPAHNCINVALSMFKINTNHPRPTSVDNRNDDYSILALRHLSRIVCRIKNYAGKLNVRRVVFWFLNVLKTE